MRSLRASLIQQLQMLLRFLSHRQEFRAGFSKQRLSLLLLLAVLFLHLGAGESLTETVETFTISDWLDRLLKRVFQYDRIICPEPADYQEKGFGCAHNSALDRRTIDYLYNDSTTKADAWCVLFKKQKDARTSLLEGPRKSLPIGKKRKRLKVENSFNLLLENLHSARNLDTTYYVTDGKQQTDFVGFRDSKIRVNIGLQDINVMPIYDDVGHNGDNEFMLGRPNTEPEAVRFSEIIEKYCRNPVPDFYNLTLEISRGRSTQAWREVCSEIMMQLGLCPQDVAVGQQFIQRSLNEPCEKLGFQPTAMKPATNSIVCKHGNDLLGLFDVNPSDTQPLQFFPAKCKLFRARCDQCLEKEQCQLRDDFERKCCQADCYNSLDCKQAASTPCTKAPLECATGDAYRYTLQPIYADIHREFHCHVRHRPSDVLYRLWFYITIPGLTLIETPKIYSDISVKDVESLSSGQKIIQFLTIEHSTGFPLHGDMMVTGRRELNDDSVSYTINSLEKESTARSITAHKMSANRMIVSAQFDEPFGYSTSTWVDSNVCYKNISKFRPVERYAVKDERKVKAVVRKTGSTFEYLVSSMESTPYLKFTVPDEPAVVERRVTMYVTGNTSVLRWWFQENPSYLVIDESLETHMALTDDNKNWVIQLSGYVNRCPGYLAVTVSDHMELEELFKYDVVISCPKYFNISFFVPHWPSKPDRMFEVIIDDTSRQYHIFLTNNMLQRTTNNRTDFALNRKSLRYNAMVFLANIGLSTAVVVVSCGCVQFIVFVLSWKPSYTTALDVHDADISTAVYNAVQEKRLCNCCIRCLQTAKIKKFVIVLYITIKLFYCIAFTFTSLSVLFSLWLSNQSRQVLPAVMCGAQKCKSLQYSTTEHFLEANTFHRVEATLNLTKCMETSCEQYIGEHFNSISSHIANATREAARGRLLSHMLVDKLKIKQNKFKHEVALFFSDFALKVNERIRLDLLRYNGFVDRLVNNSWFLYPRSLFHRIDSPIVTGSSESFLSDDKAHFAEFIDVADAKTVRLWRSSFHDYIDQFKQQLLTEALNWEQNITIDLNPCVSNTQHILSKSNQLDYFESLLKLNSSRYFISDDHGLDATDDVIVMLSNEDILKRPLSNGTYYESDFLSHISQSVFSHFPAPLQSDENHFSQSLNHRLRKQQLKNIDMVYILLYVVDGILFIYRFAYLVIDVEKLCHGTEERVVVQTLNTVIARVSSETSHMNNHTSDNKLQISGKECLDVSNNFITDSTKECKEFTVLVTSENGIVKKLNTDIHVSNDSRNSVHIESRKNLVDNLGVVFPDLGVQKNTFGKSMQLSWKILNSNEIIPKLVIAAVFLLVILLVVKLANQIIRPSILVSLGGIDTILTTARAQINSGNEYISEVSKQLNEQAFRWQNDFVKFEIRQLQEIQESFCSEHESMTRKALQGICSQEDSSKEDCTYMKASRAVFHPIFPCAILDVQPQFMSVDNRLAIEQSIRQNILTNFECIHNFVVTILSIIFVIILIPVLTEVVPATIFYLLEATTIISVRRIFVVASTDEDDTIFSRATSSDTSPNSISTNHHQKQNNCSSNLNVAVKESAKCHPKQTCISQRPTSASRRSSAVKQFSETNV